MTNLTEKFTDLETQLTAQHNAVVLSIGAVQVELSTKITGVQTRLDMIIEKLDAVNTTLTNNGAFDVTPIVNAIESLRGEGPENTLKSVNQSIWNLAGPAPGTTLTDIKSAISIIEQTLDANLPLIIGRLIDIFGQWDGGKGMTAYNLLDGIYTNDAAAVAILVRLIAQFDTSIVLPTMKDLLLTISQQQAQQIALAENPLTTIPADVCAAPLVSTGSFFQDTSMVTVDPVTFATWPATPGGDFSASYDITMDAHPILHCSNWTNYRIYVASKADSFGVITGRGTRYPCNQWVILDIPEGLIGIGGAAFNVARANDLKVYICPVNAPAAAADPGGCIHTMEYEYRCNLRQTGVQQEVFGVLYDIVYLEWQSIPGIIIAGSNEYGSGAYGYINPAYGGDVYGCLTWDMSNANVSSYFRYNFANSTDLFDMLTRTNLDAARLHPTGVVSFTLHQEPSEGYASFYFGVAAGETPPDTVWLHFGGVPS